MRNILNNNACQIRIGDKVKEGCAGMKNEYKFSVGKHETV